MIDNLKWAGIINTIAAVLYLLMGGFLQFIVLLIIGIYLLDIIKKPKKEIKEKATSLVAIGIINVVVNPIGAIFLFLGLSKSNEKEKRKKIEKIDPEARRLDMVLKLGIIIVLFAGFLLATTSWDIITNTYKVFTLLFLSALFIFLFYISDTKLKMAKTAFSYWNIAMAFLVFSLVTIGIFGTFGTYFSFEGNGNDLVFFFIFLLIALLSYFSNLKFNRIGYIYLIIFSSLLAINSLLLHVQLLINLHFLLFTLFVFCLNYYDFEQKYWKDTKELLTLFIMPIIYIFMAWQLASCSVFFMLAIFTIGNMIYYAYNSEAKNYANTLAPILSLLIIYVTLLVFGDMNMQYITLIFTGILSIIFVLTLLLKFKDTLAKNILIFINMTYILLFFTLFNEQFHLQYLVITTMIMLTNVAYLLFNHREELVLEKYLQPLKGLMFLIALYLYISKQVSSIETGYLIHFLYFITIFPLLLTKETIFKKLYCIIFYFLFIVGLLMSFWQGPGVGWFLILVSATTFGYFYKTNIEDQAKLSLIAYYILIITLFIQFAMNQINGIGDAVGSTIVLLIYFLFFVLFKENKEIKIITILLTVLPTITLINAIIEPGISNIIATRTIYLIGIYLFNKLILDEKIIKNLITSILIIGVILSVIFVASPFIGIYVGIVGLLLMYTSFRFDGYLYLFYIGIATTIINIVFQLKDVWIVIPFWLYLLVIGLTMILFVTKKELERVKTKKILK